MRAIRLRSFRQLFESLLATAPPSSARELLAGAAALADSLLAHHLSRAPDGGSSFAMMHGLYWLAANSRSEPTIWSSTICTGPRALAALVSTSADGSKAAAPLVAGTAAGRAGPRIPGFRELSPTPRRTHPSGALGRVDCGARPRRSTRTRSRILAGVARLGVIRSSSSPCSIRSHGKGVSPARTRPTSLALGPRVVWLGGLARLAGCQTRRRSSRGGRDLGDEPGSHSRPQWPGSSARRR